MNERITRIMRTEGLQLDTAAAAEHLAGIGYADTWPDDAVRTHLHAYSSMTGGKPPVDAWEAFKAKFNNFDGVSAERRHSLRMQFQREQAEARQPSPAERLAAEFTVKYGENWQAVMTPAEKMSWGRLAGFSAPVGQSSAQGMHRDLEYLTAKLERTHDPVDRGNIRNMIQSLQWKLGIKNTAAA